MFYGEEELPNNPGRGSGLKPSKSLTWISDPVSQVILFPWLGSNSWCNFTNHSWPIQITFSIDVATDHGYSNLIFIILLVAVISYFRTRPSHQLYLPTEQSVSGRSALKLTLPPNVLAGLPSHGGINMLATRLNVFRKFRPFAIQPDLTHEEAQTRLGFATHSLTHHYYACGRRRGHDDASGNLSSCCRVKQVSNSFM